MIGSEPIVGSNVVGETHFRFRVALDGANAPTLSKGQGAVAARSNVGIYTLTLRDLPAGKEFKQAQVTLCKAGGLLDLRADDGGYAPSTGVLTFYTSLSSTGALANPPAAAATNYVSVHIVFGSPVSG